VGKMEAPGDLAAVTLTTSTGYNQKVEFPKNLFGLPFQACPDGQQKIGRPKARKEVGLSGNVQRLRLLEATGSRPVCSSTEG
jgi:hypothetical protein